MNVSAINSTSFGKLRMIPQGYNTKETTYLNTDQISKIVTTDSDYFGRKATIYMNNGEQFEVADADDALDLFYEAPVNRF